MLITFFHVSEQALEEKKRILDHFNIELDNPISILQQEEAKIFFKDMDENQLYDFFVRATLLKPTQDTYGAAKKQLLIASEALAKKEKELDKHKDMYKKWNDMKTELEKAEKLDKKSHYKAELKWLHVKLEKDKVDDLAGKIAAQQEVIAIKERELLDKRQDLVAHETEYEKLKLQKRKEDEEKNIKRDEAGAIKKTWVQARKEHNELKEEVKGIQEDLSRHEKELRDLQNEARNQRLNREKAELEKEQNEQKLLKRKEELEAQRDKTEAEIVPMGQERNRLNDKLEAFKHERLAFNNKMEGVVRQKREAENDLRKLDNQSGTGIDSLASRFGDATYRLVKSIEQNKHRFSKKPVGPVGRHVNLSQRAQEEDLADLLEVELSQRTLGTFIVNNSNDYKILNSYIKEHFTRARPPTVCIMQMSGKKADISREAVRSTDEVPCLLDYLTFDNNDAFNYVVEQNKPDKTIVVSQEKAQVNF